MPIEVSALLVSLSFAVRNIFIRVGLRHTTPLISTFAVTLLTVLFFIPLTLWGDNHPAVTWMGVLWFVLAGVTAPGLALLLYFASMNRIGVARASPLASTQTLVALVIAVIFLGERPTLPVYIGTVLVVGGVVALTTEKGELRWTAKEVSLPLLASFLWGVSTVLRKMGMSEVPWPTFAGLVTSAAALAAMLPASGFLAKENRWRMEHAATPYLLLGGVCLLSGFYFHMLALGQGTVARVAPLSNISPVMTILLTAVFLRKLEKVTLRLVLSTLVIFLGVALVTAY